jgi:hypothetical protein
MSGEEPDYRAPYQLLLFAGCLQRDVKIGNEKFVLALARCLVWLPKKRRWMNGRKNARRKFRR